jgi:aspartyl-tRNA synthetase
MINKVIPETEALAEQIRALQTESTITLTGKVVESAQSKTMGLEIVMQEITVENLAEPKVPLEIFSRITSNLDTRLDWRYLDLRETRNLHIFQIQTDIERAMRKNFEDWEFIEIHSPKLMGHPSESGAELFELDYFGRPGFLAQSPQFYKQMAQAAGFNRIFEIADAFRADPSDTVRHQTEFTSIDVEISWVETHDDVMKFEEQWLNFTLSEVKKKWDAVIQEEFGVEVVVPPLPFPRIKYADAIEMIAEVDPEAVQRGDLGTKGEKVLGDIVKEKYNHEFVFVTDYPWEVRPFYHMKIGDDLTRSFDLIWKGTEITTGAQREHRYEILKQQAVEKKLSLKNMEFYLDFFKYGCPPHGGYGLGLARLLMLLLGISNIREVVFLSRDIRRLTP